MATAAHLEKLNPAQRKAVTHGEALPEKGYRAGPLLIVAGAGTGKTDTLAHRVAHLVIHGVDPARIMMLTFTRRAATEMRRRAQEITRQALNEPLGGVSHSIAQRLSWTGTFHSIGNRLLRHYAPHLQQTAAGRPQRPRPPHELDGYLSFHRQPSAAALRAAPAARPALQRHRSRRCRGPHRQSAPGAGAGGSSCRCGA